MTGKNSIAKLRIAFTVLFGLVIGASLLVTDSQWPDNNVFCLLFCLLGYVLVGIGTLGRLWCILYIGGYKSRSLITAGPYSVCRNPLYFFSLLGAVGVGLSTETLTMPAIILVMFAAYYPAVVRNEQNVLRDRHGAEFDAYCQTTPAFFPRWSLLHEPEEWTVHPRVFRRCAFDALWFIWLVGLAELAEGLREAGLLPVLAKLW
ncbi:MAG: isoprenylcysteine carboxylmethyltransferase family protein [Lentisphaeria bacterium]